MATTFQREQRASYVVGTGMLALLAVLIIIAGTANRGVPLAPYTWVNAAFDDVGSLIVGADVRENSIRIGRVDAISYRDSHAVVTLKIDGRRTLFQDAHATIGDQSTLGQKFVEIDQGSSATGPLGERTIAASRNVDSADLYQVLDVFDQPTRDATGAALRQLGGGLAGHGADLHDLVHAAPDLLAGVGTVTTALSSKEADLPTLLASANILASRFEGRQRQIGELVDRLGTTAGAVATDGGAPLADSIKNLPATLGDVRQASDALLGPLTDLHSTLTTLRSGTQALGDASPDIRGALREARPPLDKLPSVAQDATPAVDDLTSAFADARPMAPRLAETLRDAAPPLRDIAPFTPDIVTFFLNIESFVSQSPRPGVHVARLGVSFGNPLAPTATIPDPTLHRDVYPSPGQALHDRALTPVGSR